MGVFSYMQRNLKYWILNKMSRNNWYNKVMGSWPNWLQNIYIIEEQIKNSWNRVEHLITHCYTSIEQANKLDMPNYESAVKFDSQRNQISWVWKQFYKMRETYAVGKIILANWQILSSDLAILRYTSVSPLQTAMSKLIWKSTLTFETWARFPHF